jgi:hypothetical protein
MTFVLETAAMTLYQALGAALNVNQLLDMVCRSQYFTVLDTMADVHAETARRLLKEARDRHGYARRDKLILAISSLETLTTVRDRRASRRAVHDPEYLRSCWELALVTGIAYRALDTDIETARQHLDASKDLHRRWAAAIRDRDDGRLVWYSLHGTSTVTSALPRSQYETDAAQKRVSRQEHLDRFRSMVDSYDRLIERILVIGVEPTDIDTHF